MSDIKYKQLLDAGVHFGHLTSKWNPKMAPYIFMEKNGIHIIDLNKTIACLDKASAALSNIVKSGRKILFVATKKQAKEIVAEEARRMKMPYVTERWLGGMLTNFTTVRKSIKKMSSIDKLLKEDSFDNLAKRERLMLARDKEKLDKVLGGIADLTRTPAALFVVDAKKEHIAVAEAKKLGIPVFGIVDTNTDPDSIDFPIPGNDDAYKSVAMITQMITAVIEEALAERKREKDEDSHKDEEETIVVEEKVLNKYTSEEV